MPLAIYHVREKELKKSLLRKHNLRLSHQPKWAWCPCGIVDNKGYPICMYFYDFLGYCQAENCPFLKPIFEGLKNEKHRQTAL